MTGQLSQITVLMLSANPKQTDRLRLDEERREVEAGLIERSQLRDRFRLITKVAVRPRDVQRAMLDYSPQIVHFSGHGAGAAGLILEDEAGNHQLVQAEALADLFALFADQLQCVVLNACYSKVQATAIARHIPYVIGMGDEIGDRAAIEFAVAFYDGLGAGRDLEFAYRLGCSAIAMAGSGEAHVPELIRKCDMAPSPAAPIAVLASLESPDGLVRLNSGFYIASAYEARCEEEITKPGSLIRIKSPRNMGKSSLMVRVLDRATQLGYRTVMLDLDQTNQKFFHDLDQFMQWFCASVGKQLGVKVKPDEYWDDIFGANDNSTEYFEKYLLTEDDRPLVLAIDNFDRVFEYTDIETDFCGLLRGWHERSRSHARWGNLRLVIVYSQEPYLQKDINQSPFNVGLPILLGEFSVEQVRDLVQRHGLAWSEVELGQVMGLIGGHPYLVRLALYHIAAGDVSLSSFLQTAPTEAGIYSSHLLGHLKALEDYPELGDAMRTVVTSDQPVRLRSEQAFKLDSMGLVKRVENDVQPRCLLYRQYFSDRLGASG
ncbi:MAG: AAA-like domain-containing protein [Leptolyngbyaceae cyanobacterium]